MGTNFNKHYYKSQEFSIKTSSSKHPVSYNIIQLSPLDILSTTVMKNKMVGAYTKV